MMAEKKEATKKTAKGKAAAAGKKTAAKPEAAHDHGASAKSPEKAAATKSKSSNKRSAQKKSAAAQGPLRFSVTLKHVRISPRKARLVINLIKGRQVAQALQILDNSPKKAAAFSSKLLRSAIANAKERAAVDVDSLWVVGGFVDMGRTLTRFMPGAQGRANPVRKRSTHVTLQVGELR